MKVSSKESSVTALPPLTGRNDSGVDADNESSKFIGLPSGSRHHVVFSPISTDQNSDAPTISSSDCLGNIEDLFEKASTYLNPGRGFRYMVYLYGERKLLVFFWMHFSCTMIIWCK